MGNYGEMLRAIVGKTVEREPSIPKKSLAVGEDEYHDSIPLLLYRDIAKTPTKYVADAQESNAEKSIPNLSGLTIADAITAPEFYFGNPVE